MLTGKPVCLFRLNHFMCLQKIYKMQGSKWHDNRKRIPEVSGKYLVGKAENVPGVLWEENEYQNVSITDETRNISIWIK